MVRVPRDTQQLPRFSISQVSTLAASFADDVRVYAEAGVDGIGVWEIKLDDGSLEEFGVSGLGSATAVPAVPSVHPLPLLPGPDNAPERVDALLRSLEVLAPYAPAAILCFTGPGDRETGVHVSDWREPTRGWADRVLPGDGSVDLPAILGALDNAGWDGFYDLEIFSDNGTFGSVYPDSLWDLDAAELARRGRDAFFHTWSKRRVPAQAAGRRGET